MHALVDNLVSFPSFAIGALGFPKQSTLFSPQRIESPVLTIGNQNEWDEVAATWASIVRYNGSQWRMYFSGRDVHRHLRIGLATSNDGVHWTKYSSNPILDTGKANSWNQFSVHCPIVWTEQDSWKMLFTGCDSPYSRHYQVGLAESSDGIKWEEFKENPVYDNQNASTRNLYGQFETEAWGLLHEKGRYYLFYNSVTAKPRQVYLAESSDLKSWKAVSNNPILPSEGFPWSIGFMKYCAFPFKHEDNQYLLAATSDFNYHRSRIGLWKLCGDTFPSVSPKFIGCALNTSDEWCKREVDTPFAIYDAGEQRTLCYYGGRSTKNKWTEGLSVMKTNTLTETRSLMSTRQKHVRFNARQSNSQRRRSPSTLDTRIGCRFE